MSKKVTVAEGEIRIRFGVKDESDYGDMSEEDIKKELKRKLYLSKGLMRGDTGLENVNFQMFEANVDFKNFTQVSPDFFIKVDSNE